MFEIADAVTQCKFEASDKDTDEVVLYKILQVASESLNRHTTPQLQKKLSLRPRDRAAEQCSAASRSAQPTHVPV